MKADAKPTLADVAKLIANPPPEWLVSGLGFFVNIIRDTGASDQRIDEIDRLMNAIKTLRRLLPLYLALPIGPALYRGPVDALVVLDALPRIERRLERVVRPSKRTPDVLRSLCVAVILEASRLVRDKVQPQSKIAYLAYNEYWKACGNQPIGDDRNWDRPIKRAMAKETTWIREIFQRIQSISFTTDDPLNNAPSVS
jgi:hypothetical protein